MSFIEQAIGEYKSYLLFMSSEGVAVPQTLSHLLTHDSYTTCTHIGGYIANAHLPLTTAVAAVHILYLVIEMSYQIRLKSMGPFSHVTERIKTVVAACSLRQYHLPTLRTTEGELRAELAHIILLLRSLVMADQRILSGSSWAGLDE